MPQRIRLQRAVVNETHYADPEHENHLYHEHVEISGNELFFDLIFVGIGIELAAFLKQELTLARIFITFLLFATAWLTWFHVNMLLTRFHLPRAWTVALFIIMLGSLGIAIHAVDESQAADKCDKAHLSGFDTNQLGIFFSILVTRVTLCAVYIMIAVQIPLARMVRFYVVALAISSVFVLACAFIDLGIAYTLWSIALVMELLMYAVALHMTPKHFRMSVNMEHALERNQLWVILILGEGILSLVGAPHKGGFGVEYYFCEIFSFVIVYLLMKIHTRSQLEYDVTADEHALESSAAWGVAFDATQLLITAGMLGMAVGLKLAISHSQDDDYSVSEAKLLTLSLGFTLLSMNAARATHKFAPQIIFGSPLGRHYVWGAHVALSAAIMPLGVSGLHKSPVSLLTVLVVALLVLLGLESMLRVTDDVENWATSHVRHMATQTDSYLTGSSMDVSALLPSMSEPALLGTHSRSHEASTLSLSQMGHVSTMMMPFSPISAMPPLSPTLSESEETGSITSDMVLIKGLDVAEEC
eukprot:m.62213 g.62213  ORF g.62213 m.62213 type:complete len:529 (+) comp7391_c0_seq1:197-1783(+)